MIIAQLKDLPLQIKFPSVVKLIALKDLCWIASFGQHPRHFEKEHASREKIIYGNFFDFQKWS